VFEAFFWGFVGAAALIVGAIVAYAGAAPSKKLVAVIMALGTGLLIGSVSFELIDDAVRTAAVAEVGLFTLIGAAVFTAGTWWLVRPGRESGEESSSALAIVFGSVLDGIPESFVLGLTVLEGKVSIALLAGVLLSIFPEGLSSSAGLRNSGWKVGRVMRMWALIVFVSACSAALGYVLLDPASGRTGALAEAFAAGALLTMVCNTMLPEAFKEEGVFTGSLVVAGFAFAIVLSSF
jgi:ZIP family zinc transporter